MMKRAACGLLPQCNRDQAGERGGVEFSHDMRAMDFDCPVADTEHLSDRPVGETPNDTVKHLALARRKPVERGALRQAVAGRGRPPEVATAPRIGFRFHLSYPVDADQCPIGVSRVVTYCP